MTDSFEVRPQQQDRQTDTQALDPDRQIEVSRLTHASQILEALGRVATVTYELEQKEAERDRNVLHARAIGASWSAIGNALGVTPQAAMRKYDKKVKAHHREWRLGYDIYLRRMAHQSDPNIKLSQNERKDQES